MPPARDRRLLGLDLDNTVIDYAEAYRALAPRFGLPEGSASREAIRAKLRRTPEDDEEWQRFQSLLYTDGLPLAQPAAGVLDLLEACRRHALPVVIVSHKTHIGPQRFGARDLRTPARAWLARHGISPGWIPNEGVTFHAAASEKVARIKHLSPTWFVDDLEEILDRADFPVNVKRVLYRARSPWLERKDGSAVADFPALTGRVFT